MIDTKNVEIYLKYFKLSEFVCQETGENKMDTEFLLNLDKLRHACGFPFTVSSGYRSTIHHIEMAKKAPGMHTKGIAADIKTANGSERYSIVENALKLGFTGIGIGKTFTHVDTRRTAPVIWTYN